MFQANAEGDSDELVDPPKVEDKIGVVPHGLSTDSNVVKSNAEKFEFQAKVSWLAYGLCSAPKTLIESPFRASRAIMGNNNYICRVSFSSSVCGKNLQMEEMKVASDLLVGDPASLEKKIDAIRFGASHGLLQQGNPEYNAKRHQLYEYYHPLEFSPTIGLEEKTKLMEEWWGKTQGLLVEGGLTYDSIRQSVGNANIPFREGERDAPVLIFSAGLADIIEEVLRQKLHRSFKNVRIVSNRMVFDDDGRLVTFKGDSMFPAFIS
ncbi:Cytosolic 5'-nucleotidase III [Glycine soja]|uniref:5'-nucleotidase n=1 Tax=Glycine soja TaxID=3848 RepID=A0A0B2PBJ5_GLYSO|nr:Cytosolic 5'-nucleotidase III [Glycine soja]